MKELKSNHRIAESIRKAKRNIKIAQKLHDRYLLAYWQGVVYGLQVRIGTKIVKHLPKREKTKKL